MVADVKQYECYTLLDKNNRMTGHFCMDSEQCYHCKAGVPFINPSDDLLPLLTSSALLAIRDKNLAIFEEMRDRVAALRAEIESRG